MKIIPAPWLLDYLLRAKPDFLFVENIVVCDRGFLSYRIKDDVLIIVDCYGDGRFWDSFAVKMAKDLGLKRIKFWTRRNPRAFERRYGYRVVAERNGIFELEKEVEKEV